MIELILLTLVILVGFYLVGMLRAKVKLLKLQQRQLMETIVKGDNNDPQN